jgi:hypothetical protein
MTSTFDYIGSGRLSEAQIKRMEAVRGAFKTLECELFGCQPENGEGCVGRLTTSRMTSLVRTKLDEACMWAIKSICFEGIEVK